MIPDRTSLMIACAIAALSVSRLSPSLQQVLGLMYAVHAWRAHRRDLAAAQLAVVQR